jgi:hypothetical protein
MMQLVNKSDLAAAELSTVRGYIMLQKTEGGGALVR